MKKVLPYICLVASLNAYAQQTNLPSSGLDTTTIRPVATGTYPYQRSAPAGYKVVKQGVIIGKGPAGSFNELKSESPVVIWSPLHDKYIMSMVGYRHHNGSIRASVGFYESTNLTSWMRSSIPTFQPTDVPGDPDQNGCTGGTLYYEKGTYYLFYIGLTQPGYEGGVKSLCLATSTDMVNWTRRGVVISPNPSTPWRNAAIWHPSLVRHNGRYYCFFNADGGAGNESIGYATSPNLLSWTVDDANSPLLTKRGSGWEAQFVGDPSVYKIGNTWYMKYFGVGANYSSASDGIATTTEAQFPLGWVRYSGNPVLRPGPPGSYDALFAHKPFVFITPQAHYHFYTAVDKSNPENRTIALAVELK